mmetsp:Transcript_44018/g.138340  ORF Transcript_44018/g.138340 Transcript_44018/m.138340 type:complete len:283 (-) Transcript_44018:1321-2169(-)
MHRARHWVGAGKPPHGHRAVGAQPAARLLLLGILEMPEVAARVRLVAMLAGLVELALLALLATARAIKAGVAAAPLGPGHGALKRIAHDPRLLLLGMPEVLEVAARVRLVVMIAGPVELALLVLLAIARALLATARAINAGVAAAPLGPGHGAQKRIAHEHPAEHAAPECLRLPRAEPALREEMHALEACPANGAVLEAEHGAVARGVPDPQADKFLQRVGVVACLLISTLLCAVELLQEACRPLAVHAQHAAQRPEPGDLVELLAHVVELGAERHPYERRD